MVGVKSGRAWLIRMSHPKYEGFSSLSKPSLIISPSQYRRAEVQKNRSKHGALAAFKILDHSQYKSNEKCNDFRYDGNSGAIEAEIGCIPRFNGRR